MISLDTETTGVDTFHGAKPFFVSSASDDGNVTFWGAPVDPLTREPRWNESDLGEIDELLGHVRGWSRGRFSADIVGRHAVCGQNVKFDAHALEAVGVGDWPWEGTFDTLIAGHLLASNQPHDLTSMAMQYLGVDVQPYEDRLKEAVVECRKVAGKKFPDWNLAKAGKPGMPSVKSGTKKAEDKPWKNDCWLPAALAEALGYPKDHPWRTVLREYGNSDAAVTLPLWHAMREELERRDYWAIFVASQQLVEFVGEIEDRGVSMKVSSVDEMKATLRQEMDAAQDRCRELSGFKPCPACPLARSLFRTLCKTCKDTGLVPKVSKLSVGVTKEMREVIFSDLKVEPFSFGDKSGSPSVDKESIEFWRNTLEDGPALEFISCLGDFRDRASAFGYLEQYERFWLPSGEDGYMVLRPHLNQTGAQSTTRFSSSNPNGQNVSNRERFGLRSCFCPLPGREYWAMDAENIELRLPAYESGEEILIDLFERPHDPPFYGSEHMFNFSIVYPEVWERWLKEVGPEKVAAAVKKHEPALYKRCKGGKFAMQYGSVDKADGTGTADRSFGRPGSQAKLTRRLHKKEALNQQQIALANKRGFVETMPDKSVDPTKGYPLMTARNDWGRVKPTEPLSYHVQGTAGWWMKRAIWRCGVQLREWRKDGCDAWMSLTVHDELLFDFPKGKGKAEPWRTNLPYIRALRRLMEQGGIDLGVPTPVGVKYHEHSWADGIKVA